MKGWILLSAFSVSISEVYYIDFLMLNCPCIPQINLGGFWLLFFKYIYIYIHRKSLFSLVTPIMHMLVYLIVCHYRIPRLCSFFLFFFSLDWIISIELSINSQIFFSSACLNLLLNISNNFYISSRIFISFSFIIYTFLLILPTYSYIVLLIYCRSLSMIPLVLWVHLRHFI